MTVSGTKHFGIMAKLGNKCFRKYIPRTRQMIMEPKLSIAMSTFPHCKEREELEKLAKEIVEVIFDNIVMVNSTSIAKLWHEPLKSEGGKKWQVKQIEMYQRRSGYAQFCLRNRAGWRHVFDLLTRKVNTDGQLIQLVSKQSKTGMDV